MKSFGVRHYILRDSEYPVPTFDQLPASTRRAINTKKKKQKAAKAKEEQVWKDDKDGVTLTFYGPKALASKKPLKESDGVNDGVSDGANDGVKAVANAIDDGVSKGVIDGVSDGVKAELIKIAEILNTQEGLNAQEVTEAIGKSKPTVERYLRIARKLGIIEFKGAPRTGGYYLVIE